MATTTPNLGLTKPSYSDTADIAVINGNMDKLDTAANALEGGLAIISNNNTHVAISKGQYVYVRAHGTLAEGLYTANSNIAANATLSSSNLTAASIGENVALIADQVATLNSKFTATRYVPSSSHDVSGLSIYQLGSLAIMYGTITIASDVPAWTTFMNLWSAIPKNNNAFATILGTSNYLEIVSQGAVQSSVALTSGQTIKVAGVWNT